MTTFQKLDFAVEDVMGCLKEENVIRKGGAGIVYRGSMLSKEEVQWRIATEAAKGLSYLHHDCSPLIHHRNVKSNNILLDSNFEAHVADFGPAKFLHDLGASKCISSITEYAYTLQVDEKSNVYSFGVVLLELITGQRSVGGLGDGVDIVRWVWKTVLGVKEDTDLAVIMAIVDNRLTPSPAELITNLFKVAMLCVEEQSTDQSTMREVVHMLSDLDVAAR
ncbi:hypothetical protein ZIOFF_053555 [Zingiber officinale]|uniref:Protein kinase domain-containing protein n=1 Tax=Zingiber officinale TaxID=94328 RepID=A0A8J5KD02_ZINOF|nr:hypothetical protein ZIOFF_053555 [Zingiber officinale]